MNPQQIRKLTLQGNQIRTEHDERMRTIFQQLERECRETERFDAIDDIHQAALAEFELDSEAVQFLNSMYVACRTQYITATKLLHARRRNIPPWESAAR
jgi:hypothetical protein